MRVVIVEDEALALATLRELLRAEPDVELAGTASDGRSAVRAIDSLVPDVLFLDVHLPELSGLEALAQAAVQPPAVVFTTAFNRYAVEAFRFEAVDYLIKPFGRRRFRETLDRVRKRLSGPATGAPARSLGGGLLSRPLRRLYVRRNGRVASLDVSKIERIEGARDYSQVYAESGKFLVLMGLGKLHERLPQDRFVRVHRSHLVNLDLVAEIRPRDPHRLELTTRSGAVIGASRTGSALLRTIVRMK